MDRAALRDRDAAIRASNFPAFRLAREHGISEAHVHRIRGGAPRAPATRKERFQLEVLEGGWVAACMEPDEWADWVARNPVGLVDEQFADRPCRDCPASFAAEMRAIGRCNGQPSGSEGEPADHDEEDHVNDVRPGIAGGVRGSVALALTPPPCDTCAHEPICVLKIALRKATSAEVVVAPLPDGLTVKLSAAVECRFYNRVKGSRGGNTAGRKLNLSDEERARRGEQARANTAAKLAAKAAAG